MPESLTLPYLEIDAFAGMSLSEPAYTDRKWDALARLGIQRREDATPLVAWRDHVADSNGIDRALLDPAQGGVLDLMFASTAVRNFVFFLA
jgi:hypothetical protein